MAVEDKIGRDRHEPCSDGLGGLGDMAIGEHVGAIGTIAVGLGAIDVGPGGRVQDQRRLVVLGGGQHGGGVGHIQVGVAQADAVSTEFA